MIGSRCTSDNKPAVTIRPPLAPRANAATPRSISSGSRRPTGLTSTPSDGATECIAASCAIPVGCVGSRRTTARVTLGVLEQFEQFAAHAIFEQGKTGGVAARARKACNITGADRVRDLNEHDRHSARCLQQWSYPCGAVGQDDLRCERDQFRCVTANALVLTRAPSVVDVHIAVG